MVDLLTKTRKITSILQRTVERLENELPYSMIAAQLADIIDCNVCIVDEKGAFLGYVMKHKTHNDRTEKLFNTHQFPVEYVSGINRMFDTEANLPISHEFTIFPYESHEIYPNGVTTIVPIYSGGMRLGTLIIWKNEEPFNNDDLILAEISSTVVGLQLLNHQTENLEEAIRQQTAVTMAVSALSYSELKAVAAILAELNGHEGRLTASSVADRIGITRSVIVNALRKLESAGVIESRSLGMKGTYIRVLNEGLFAEVEQRQ